MFLSDGHVDVDVDKAQRRELVNDYEGIALYKN